MRRPSWFPLPEPTAPEVGASHYPQQGQYTGVLSLWQEDGKVHLWAYDDYGDSPGTLTPAFARQIAADLIARAEEAEA